MVIYKKLVAIGDVLVVAPSVGQSGSGHSITFAEPLMCNKVNVNEQFTGYSVAGSPADCVKLAVMQFCAEPIDLVVSGVNSGANVGINVYYSGTVAAAMEAAFFKIPAVAMSLARDEQMDFDVAAEFCMNILNKLLPLESGKVININVPQQSRGRPAGIKVVPQSTEAFDEEYLPQKDDRGRTAYQLTGGLHKPEETTTDTIALAEGFITITALQPGMTHYEETEKLKALEWQLNE